jgi:hypothetical protein
MAKLPSIYLISGELPKDFWLADEFEMLCATDTAFMSTSKNRDTPIEYMGEGRNVLWALRPHEQSDSGYHCGADVSDLSQFGSEQEVARSNTPHGA